MKEFLKNNTVTYNLMSFTGFKSLLIFSLLMDGPKSYEEIREVIRNHEYLHEDISIDTLRIYLNSLREIGCNVIRKNVNGITKYSIETHPFTLKIDEEQTKNIIKVYKTIIKSIDVSDLMSLQKFFNKISTYITDESLKENLQSISPLNNIDLKLIEDLMNFVQNNTEITVLYNSKNTKKKEITILCDKLSITNGKLYLSGINSEHDNYAGFLVSNIEKILSINIKNTLLETPTLTVGYEYSDSDSNLELLNCEQIIKTKKNKIIIEITSKNKFEIMQRIMFLSNKCKVLYPESFKSEIIAHLKKMKEGYFGK